MAEKKTIVKNDWISSFSLTGRPKINDFTFKINERSEKSDWIYNAMNLGIDCGERSGVVWAELMGGYSENNENKIYAHGKTESGDDDFKKQIIVAWEDRKNLDIIKEIGRRSLIRVGLEKTSTGDIFYTYFLSAYDAIKYVKEHLSEDMVVNVSGNLKYSSYNDTVQVRKNITSIVLSKAEPSDFKATFTQTILIDKDSASLKNIDKDKGIMYVDARVLDYVKEVNGIDIKGQFPYNKQFEFAMDFSKEAQCKKIMEKLFKVKKGINQITMEGEFVESGAVVQVTIDDLPQDIRDLIDMGMYTEEEACAKCTANGSRERRMVLLKPLIKLVGDDKIPIVQVFENRYDEDDLVLDYLYKNDSDDMPFDTDEESSGDDSGLDWLNSV